MGFLQQGALHFKDLSDIFLSWNKKKKVLIVAGCCSYTSPLSGRIFNMRAPVDREDHGCTSLGDSSWACLCLVDPGRNCPLSTDPSWAYWHQILHETITCENANLILEQCLGAALYLSVCQKSVSSVSHLGTGLNRGGGRGTWDQHARWCTCFCTAHFGKKRHFLLSSSGAMSVFLWDISGHWEIIF